MEKRLGLGLAGLFAASNNESVENEIYNVEINKIKVAEWQPRKHFDEEHLNELASSIKEYGVLQPILLRKINDFYEIIAGERRYRASKIVGLTTIPALIVKFDDNKSLAVSMIENLQRKDLSPMEQAEGFAFLIDKLGVTQEELSQKLGFSRSYITNYLRVNSLSDEIKTEINQGNLSIGHAKVLVNKENADQLAKKVIEKKLSVRQLEEIVYKNNVNADLEQFEKLLTESLKFKVNISLNKKVGKITINFKTLEDLDSIIQKICFNV